MRSPCAHLAGRATAAGRLLSTAADRPAWRRAVHERHDRALVGRHGLPRLRGARLPGRAGRGRDVQPAARGCEGRRARRVFGDLPVRRAPGAPCAAGAVVRARAARTCAASRRSSCEGNSCPERPPPATQRAGLAQLCMPDPCGPIGRHRHSSVRVPPGPATLPQPCMPRSSLAGQLCGR